MNSTHAIAEIPTARRMKEVHIERRSARGLTYDQFLKEYVGKGCPVIITDASPQWVAMRNWTPEYFRNTYGSKTVDVTYGVKMQFDELIDAVLASTQEKPGPYLHKVIIHQDFPELVPDLSPESVYGFPRRYCSPLMPKRWQRPDGFLKLLIGGVGGKFPLMHYDVDNSNALITEIYGDKEFVLFSPQDTPYVYPFADSPHTSQIDNPDDADFERFPLYAKATQYRGVIRPGEAIFVPSAWWHSARVVTTSISVCTNMLDGANWTGFVNEACDAKISPSLANRVVKRTYLTIAGLVMSAVEGLQRMLPRSISGRLGRLSPIASSGGLRARY